MTTKTRSLGWLSLLLLSALVASACSRSVEIGDQQALGTIGNPPRSGGACNTGLTACAGVCRDLATDPMRCGGCGVACGTDETCAAGVCTGSTCPDPNAPGVEYVSRDPLACAAALFQCDAGEEPFDNGCGCGCVPAREVASGQCVRTEATTCKIDSDCKPLGCGGELCTNPAQSAGNSICDCVSPPALSCGCVNGACAWWK